MNRRHFEIQIQAFSLFALIIDHFDEPVDILDFFIKGSSVTCNIFCHNAIHIVNRKIIQHQFDVVIISFFQQFFFI